MVKHIKSIKIQAEKKKIVENTVLGLWLRTPSHAKFFEALFLPLFTAEKNKIKSKSKKHI